MQKYELLRLAPSDDKISLRSLRQYTPYDPRVPRSREKTTDDVLFWWYRWN